MSEETEARQWLGDYLERYRCALFDCNVDDEIIAFHKLCLRVRSANAKIIFIGNGASASISSHAATDFTKQGGVRALSFNEANLITAFANDYGYENWAAKAISFYAVPGDAVVLISSSGRSPNIVEAAREARKMDLPLVTFTGFASDNPVKKSGEINFWVDSKAYNIVENVHSIWITTTVDLLIGKAEYSTC